MNPAKDRVKGPVRRVVTGTRADGKSAVLSDSDNPYAHARGAGSGTVFNEIWAFNHSPASLGGQKDGGDHPLSHSPPAEGAHFRVIQSGKEDATKIDMKEAEKQFAEMNEGGLSERNPSARHWNMHRTRTVDYGIATYGGRIHVLPEAEFFMAKGDVVVQLGHLHSWNSTRGENVMIFDMIGGEFPHDD